MALTADGLDRRLGKFRCTEGLTPAEVTLGEASGDQLYVQALSAEGLALYVGRITRDATLGRGLVTLYATASR